MIKNDIERAMEYFDKAISTIEFHLGPYHPLNSSVYSILGFYNLEKKNYQDAFLLYRSSLMCCTRILGSNHPHTGEVYIDLANLSLKMQQKEEALKYYEKAFLVFEASKSPDCLECAVTSYQMATLLLSFGNFFSKKYDALN